MILSPELIEFAKKEIQIGHHFKEGKKVIAQHTLHKMFTEATKWKHLPKIIFYILLQDHFGPPRLKDDAGNLGYQIMLNEEQKDKTSVASKDAQRTEP
jgi:hypothetical protein